jgi:predicted nucleic acid-binding protein
LGNQRRDLMDRFLARFAPLLPDGETARLWARIKTSRERQGRPITFADAWIAAAAVQMNLPLVTPNARDYEAIKRLMVVTAPM